MKLGITYTAPSKLLRREAALYQQDLRQASIIATDKAARRAQTSLKRVMRTAGLGRLGNAVGSTSTLRKDDRSGRTPYGVIFARGGDDSLAGGALEAYSQGVTIRAQQKQWLAFQTDALPRRIGRYRTTPERYNSSSLVQSIGKLRFKPGGPDRAYLVVDKVSLSPKNGRAKKLGPRKPRTRIVPDKEVVAFVLIRVTRRGRRFDKDVVIGQEASRMPDDLATAMRSIELARKQGRL